MASSSNNVALVTGATGFLGKVVVEELLRQKHTLSLKSIILLVRAKNGETARQRFCNTIVPSACFSNLRPDWTDDVEVFDGDLSVPRCGLSDDAYGHVANNTTHIIHVAGCVKFNSPVPEAISSNVDGVLNVLALGRSCDKLRRIVTTSTAYVSTAIGPVYAELSPLPVPASQLYATLKAGNMNAEQAIGITGHPNVYTLSKCLAEHLVFEQRANLSVTIVRPSIISAALKYPKPGWIDSKAAFAGLVLCFGKGILRVIDGRRDTKLDIVPVDEVASRLIQEVFRSDHQPAVNASEFRMTFSVATDRCSLRISEICRLLEQEFNDMPGSDARRFSFVGRGWLFKGFELLYHRGPLTLQSAYLGMRGETEKQKQVKKALKILKDMNAVFSHYTAQKYDFRPEEPSPMFEPTEYLRVVCSGVWEHLV
jgi:thioester reductase-like protein